MSTRQIAFAIQGMFCAKCAVDIERTLTRVDGVVAAQVNYATERATVIYDPARILTMTLINAIRSRGYKVPLVRVALYADDLLYAGSAQTIEKVLGRTYGVMTVSVDLAARSIALELLPDYARSLDSESALGRFGFHSIASPTIAAERKFWLRAAIVTGLAFLVVASAGAHAGFFAPASLLHSPLVVMALSMLALLGAGLPFYVFAYDAASQGIFDTSVVTALLAIVSAIASLPLAMISSAPWLTDAGFVVTTTLTAGWFLVRALQIRGAHRSRGAATKNNSIAIAATQTQLGAISDGSRH